MDVVVRAVAGCPNEAPAVELVRAVLAELGLDGVAVRTAHVGSQAEAEATGLLGSPSILVDGEDVFAEPGRLPGLTCRVYTTETGPAGLPSARSLRAVLARRRPGPSGRGEVVIPGDRY